jgi:cell division protein FtsL
MKDRHLNTSEIIAIIAVAVSLVSIGLLFADNLNFHSEIISLNNNITEQSQTIKDLGNKIDLNKQTIVQLQTNNTILSGQINSLNNRIDSLEQQFASLAQQVGSLESNQQLVHPAVQCPNSHGVVEFCNSIGGGGVTENRIYKKLSLTLPNDYWTAEFEYKFTSSSIPNHYILALTATSDDPTSPSQPEVIFILHGKDLDQLVLQDINGYSDHAIPINVDTQYYVKLERTPTQLILSVFSDPARKIPVQNSPIISNITANEYSNLNFVQHADSKLAGSARVLTAELDNTIIYNTSNPSQILFKDDYSSTDGWTQVGTSVFITK